MISMQYILHDLKKVVCFLFWGHLQYFVNRIIGLQYSVEMSKIIYKDLQVGGHFKRFHKISKHFKNTES